MHRRQKRHGPAQGKALPNAYVQALKGAALLRCLDSLCDKSTVDFIGKTDKCGCQRSASGIAVYSPRKAQIKLDYVGPDFKYMRKPCISCPDIVHCNPNPVPKRRQSIMMAANARLVEAIEVEHGYGPRVTTAINHGHIDMGDPQKESVGHLFAIRALLNPDLAKMRQ